MNNEGERKIWTKAVEAQYETQSGRLLGESQNAYIG